MAKAPAKKIMRALNLHEISVVTAPAQEGATMVLMKSKDAPASHAPKAEDGPIDVAKLSADEKAELILKGRLLLTEPHDGHSHLVDVGPYAQERGGGTTDCCDSGGSYHSHPYVIGADGTITIGMAKGHTHGIMTLAKVKAAALAASPGQTTEGEDMDQNELAKLRALAEMSDVQKAHFNSLGTADQEAFIAMSGDQRTAEVAKAAGPDPVVYKSRSGREYRASTDATVLDAVKEADAALAALEVEKSARADARALELAKGWTHMSGTIEEKVAKAKAILGAPADAQKAALDAIEEHRKAMEPFFTRIGTQSASNAGNSGGMTGFGKSADQTDAEAELMKMADEASIAGNISREIALDNVVQTMKGKALYARAYPRQSAH